MILLVTGPSGTGKTRRCERAANLVLSSGRSVAGVICPGVEIDGERVRILARSLPGGQTQVLARLREPEEDGAEVLATQRWIFDPAVAKRADARLARITETDLLIIDELGPLEFERGEGFVSAFPLLDRGEFGLALVVVRPSLLDAARERWPSAQTHDVTRDPEVGIPVWT